MLARSAMSLAVSKEILCFVNKTGFIAPAQLYFLPVSTGTGPPVKQQHYVPS
jgi:hypothetical protein